MELGAESTDVTEASRRRQFVEALLVRFAFAAAFAVVFAVFGACGWLDWQTCVHATAATGVIAAINLPYWWLAAWAGFPTTHFVAHWIVDVIALTVLVHILGGIDAPYVGLAYTSLILIAAVFGSRGMAIRLAALASLSFATLVICEATGTVAHSSSVWQHHFTPAVQVFSLITVSIFLFGVASVAGTLADQLKAANVSLREFSVRIEEQNRTLERRVKERTSELARATQEIEDLVQIISHDLKNVTVACTETARKLVASEGDTLSPRGKRYATHLLEDARSMSRMLQDLLKLFQDTDAPATKREWVDVAAVVKDSLSRVDYQIEAKGIEVVVGPLPTVYAETSKIRHIFDNLIGNACKYVGDVEPARVEIGGTSTDKTVNFFVRDNGIGLDPRQLARIFQLYHRSPKQEVGGVVQEGHGVGLAIVKRIVERYGGTIAVESAPRRGATFRVTLPRGSEGP